MEKKMYSNLYSKPLLHNMFSNVSIQVQPFCYQSQPVHNPPGSKCHTRDTSIAIQHAIIINQDTTISAHELKSIIFFQQKSSMQKNTEKSIVGTKIICIILNIHNVYQNIDFVATK